MGWGRRDAGQVRDAWRMGLTSGEGGPERLPAELVSSGGGRVHVLRLLRRALAAAAGLFRPARK